MTIMDQEWIRHALVMALSFVDSGLSVLPTAKLFGLPSSQIEGILAALCSERLAVRTEGKWRLDHTHPAIQDSLDHAVQYLARGDAPLSSGDVVRGLVLCARGNTFDGVKVLLTQLRLHTFSSASAAGVCLDVILGAMEHVSLDGGAEEARRQYILTVIEIADVSAYFIVKSQEVCCLLDRAIDAAQSHGDNRSVAILHIIKAHMLTFAMFDLSPEAERLFQIGFEMSRSFDDADMKEYISTFLGFRHFLKGEFVETVRHLVSVRRGFTLPHAVYWWALFYAVSSCFVGLDRQGVGILESCWRSAELRGDRISEAFWRLHLALILLMSGKKQQALQHLDVLNEGIGNDSLPMLHIRLLWVLSYCHFLNGSLTASHATLARAAQIIQDSGLGCPTYHFPWMLGMLHAFRCAGLPDVPVFSFPGEVERALSSRSLQLRASAWRVKGLMLLDSEGGLEQSREAFKQSLKLFLAVGNPVEAARVKLDLARANMFAGRRKAAGRLREAAFAAHQFYRQLEWPMELPRPHDGQSRVSTAKTSFGRLEYGKTAKSSLRNLEDAYYHLIANLCRDLRVEQGAFFDVLNGELHCLGRYNLSKMQFESSAFSHCRKWLHKEAASSQISRREGRESHMACIPVSREGKHFLIYLASTYFTKEIDELSNAVLRAAADSFSQNLHLAENSIPQSHGVAASHAGELVILPQSDTGALLTRDTAMLQLLQKSEQIAVTDASVLIFGETGVGKELLARHLHKHSGRTGPFVSVHPASMTETLFESTFFGHEKGSFTGATSQKIGFFELAHRGTLFIDEIGEMPLSMQTKFLRVLQERSFIRVGGLREIGSDFRLLTATNRDLGKEIAVGNFRQDLFYRISVVPLHMPPLRMRGGDAVLLAQSFLSFFARKYHRENVSLNKSDLLKIASYPWPGNVRELENVIERAVILHKEGPLELSMYISKGESREKSCNTPPSADIISDWPSLEELERRYIKLVLAHADGKVYGDNSAEAVLGIGRSTLYSKIRKFGFKVRRHYD